MAWNLVYLRSIGSDDDPDSLCPSKKTDASSTNGQNVALVGA